MAPINPERPTKQRVESGKSRAYIAKPMNHKNYTLASYCSSPAWGGLEMNVLRFLQWMKQRSWNLVFYGDPNTRLYQEVSRSGIRTAPVTTRLRSGDLVNAWRLSRLARRDGARWLVVHRSPDIFMGVFARLFSRGRLRLIYSQNMHIGKDKKDPYHSWLYRRIDAMETPLKWLADRVLEKTTLPPERLHILPRGVEIDTFTSLRPSRAEARQRLGLPTDQVVLGVVGRIDPKKGQDIAIEALAQLGRLGYRPHLLLVGDQSHNEGDEFDAHVRQLVVVHRLVDQVHFLPFREDIEWIYAALDVYLMTSKSECYGMVTLEALLSGLPVIGTRDGGTIDLILPGQNGLLVQPRHVGQLVTAIRTFLDDPESARRMGKFAREDAMTKFSHVQQCEAWEKLLADLA